MNREEIINWLIEEDEERLQELWRRADTVRRESVGDEIHIRGIIEISNHCRRDCLYCGLRKSNIKLKRYRMAREEILGAVRRAAAAGRKTIVLQSGEDPLLTASRIAELIKNIKEEADVAVTLSLGEYSRGDYVAMKKAGADRYLLKHETIDPSLYQKLHPDMVYENRIRCLEWLKDAGFQVGAGIMIGLPGQTVESVADDILFMKRMEFDMAGIGPFIPHPDTPLADAPSGTLKMTLKTLALTRIAVPCLLIPATTAVGTIHPNGRELALQRGANVIMPNATPLKYRELYQIYPNRICIKETPDDCGICIEMMITSLGRKAATDYGHSYRLKLH